MAYAGQFTAPQIEEFTKSWPCHGLPDLSHVTAQFSDDGDLITLTAGDETGKPVDTAEFDGPALAALVDEIQKAALWERRLATSKAADPYKDYVDHTYPLPLWQRG